MIKAWRFAVGNRKVIRFKNNAPKLVKFTSMLDSVLFYAYYVYQFLFKCCWSQRVRVLSSIHVVDWTIVVWALGQCPIRWSTSGPRLRAYRCRSWDHPVHSADFLALRCTRCRVRRHQIGLEPPSADLQPSLVTLHTVSANGPPLGAYHNVHSWRFPANWVTKSATVATVPPPTDMSPTKEK